MEKTEGIPALREQIDQVDLEILELINRRAGLALQIGQLKAATAAKDEPARPIYVPEREKAVFARLAEHNPGPLDAKAVRGIYREIVSACRALEKTMRVAYYGPPATYTHMAAMGKFGSAVELMPRRTIREVIQSVETEAADYGVVPVENSTAGVVESTLDVLANTEVRICSETFVVIHHNLLSKAEDPARVKRIYSHPQGTAQCRLWLAMHMPNVEIVEATSTAQGASQAASDPESATIASRAAADEYGLNILFENIEDNPRNRTRFLVVGMNRPERTGHDKTSVMLSVRHAPGALYHSLEAFERHGINLTMIESRPTKQTPWEYLFFIDMQGFVTDEPIAAALKDLETSSLFVRVLGSYPEAE
ncbi:MAG TPA: prephenate dehydratase [Armatimonadota bacterium]